MNAEWTPPDPPPPQNQSLAPVWNVSSPSPEPEKANNVKNKSSSAGICDCFDTEGTNLFKVGELDQLHGHLRVLQLHSFAHAGLGVGRGQTDHGLQRSGRHWRGLWRKGGVKVICPNT